MVQKYGQPGDKKWKGGVRSKRRVAQIPGANIKEFLVTILSEAARPQILYLSLKGEFWICSEASSKMVRNSFH
jgi:hypothetical protein